MEQQIAKLMKNLGITREEAIQVIKDDERIDKGEKLFELNDEQKANAKKATQVSRKPAEVKVKRERKENTDKQFLITTFINAIAEQCDQPVDIKNKEREFEFVMSGVKYKVVLSQPRS